MKDYTTSEKEVLHDVEDENNILANSTMIPNIIDDMDLSAYAFRLYIRFKRRVNQNRDGSTKGEAYDSTRTLAKTCKMSTAQVTRAKRELVQAGLIRIQKIKGKHGEWAKDHVTIIDIWEANKIFYSKNGLSIEVTAGDRAGEILWGKEAREVVRDHPNMKAKIPAFIQGVINQRANNI